MSKIFENFLRVREADEADYGKSVVRIHRASKPRGINWGDNVNISLDKKNWITSRLEPASDSVADRIYIDIPQRGLLNRDVIGVQRAQPGVACQFYIRKAVSWKLILYGLAGVAVFALLVYWLTL